VKELRTFYCRLLADVIEDEINIQELSNVISQWLSLTELISFSCSCQPPSALDLAWISQESYVSPLFIHDSC